MRRLPAARCSRNVPSEEKQSMKLLEVAIETRDDKACLVGVVQTSNPSKEIRVEFSYPRKYESFLMPTADAFFPVLLLPAMAAGETLELVPPLSRKLSQAAPHIQGILNQWYRGELHRVEVHAPIRDTDPLPPGKGVASFFSGGVDSYFTLLRNIHSPLPGDPPITHLIFLDGYENPFEKMKAHPTTIQGVLEAAEHYGKEAILGETNIRSLFTRVAWGTQYHGAAMGGAAHSLSAGLGFVYLASSYNYASMRPWGSHPLLDPYWSSERLTVRHDGAEARRVEKISPLIENDPFALSHLRVCIDSRGKGGNCGRCRKCLRTMTVLSLLGKLEGSSFPDFPRKFDTKIPREIIRKHGSSIESEVRNASNTLEMAAGVANPDPRVIRYLSNVVRLGEKRVFWNNVRRGWKVYFGALDLRVVRSHKTYDR